MPRSSSTCTPSMVVPPGLVTISFSWPGCLPLRTASSAEPATARAAASVACARGMPSATAASERASMNIATKAGVLPATAPMTSTMASSIHQLAPTASKMRPAASRSASLAAALAHMPDTPLPTKAGVLGITRTKRSGRPNSPSIQASVLPAAMDTTNACVCTASRTWAMASDKNWGFTASTTTSAHAATAALSDSACTPKASTASRDACAGSHARTSSGAATPSFSTPPIIACAMFPAPMKPILISAPCLFRPPR